MVTPNDVLAFGLLLALAGLVLWTVWQNVVSVVDAEVGSIRRPGDGSLEADLSLVNEAGRTLALESGEVSKVRLGDVEARKLVVDLDDDMRLPIQPGESREGWLRIRLVGGGKLPETARYRVLLVFRSPSGAEMAEVRIDG